MRRLYMDLPLLAIKIKDKYTMIKNKKQGKDLRWHDEFDYILTACSEIVCKSEESNSMNFGSAP